MDEQILCSIADASRILGIGRTKTYDLLRDGHLTSMQIGSRRLVRVDSIKALVAASGGAA